MPRFHPVGTWKNLLRDPIAAQGGARPIAYPSDMSRYSRSVRLALGPLATVFPGTPVFAQKSRYTRHCQAGMALLEILISITLGLVLLFGIGTIFVGSNQTYRVQEENARIQEAGRYALEVIGRSIRQAGYADIWGGPVARKVSFQGTPVHGFDAVCPTTAPVTDMFIVQYDGLAGEQDCQAGNISAGQVVQHTFFIAGNELRCDAVRAAVAPEPESSGVCPSSGTGINLLNDVEDLQVLYGIDTTGDQSADRYLGAPVDWSKVVSVRVCILIRSPNVRVVVGNQRFLNCAGALGTAAAGAEFTSASDGRLRRAFLATYSLRNRINSAP